jgi:hypothetical protein
VPNCAPVAPPDGFVITPSTIQPQRSQHDDAEYRENYTVAEYVNALFALDNGWTGEGVKVAILDNGILEIPELEGQIDRELSRDFGFATHENGVTTYRTGDARIGDENSWHGTPIGALIAGRNDGQGIQGLAPNVTLVSLRADGMVDGNEVNGVDGHLAVRYAADNAIPLINRSLGRMESNLGVNRQLRDAVTYYNQETQGLLINSAGNNSEADPRGWVDVNSENAESWLFVVALNSDLRAFEIADYSTRCGAAMNRCVAAPGLVETHNVDGELRGFQGTSFAAPVVTSVAAMILSKWPQLTGVDAGNIILNTARDLGAPGVDEIYGHGLVDARAALEPQNPTLSNGTTSGSINGNMMVMGNAFGGYTTNSVREAFEQVTVLDAYGRDYTGDMSGAIIQPALVDNMAMFRRVEAQSNMRSAGFVTPEASAVVGVTAFDTGLRDANGVAVLRNQLTNAEFAFRMGDGLSLIGGFNSNNNVTQDIMGLAPTSDAMFAYSPLAQTSVGVRQRVGNGALSLSGYTGGAGDMRVNGATVQFEQGLTSLKLGLVDEVGSVFGTPTGAGMMRFGDGAQTAFIEAASGFDLGKWSFDGFASLGATRLRMADDMMMTDAGMITSGRFGFIASRSALDGTLSFGIAQPLVVIDGDATFTVGDRYSMDVRGLLFQDRRVNLSGEIVPQFTIGYERIGERSDFRLGAAADAAGRDVRAVASWNLRFGEVGR